MTRAPRKLDHDYAAIRARLGYLCQFLFGGNKHELARTLGIPPQRLALLITDSPHHGALTVRMAAHIVSRLGVNAEWFLTGNGPMMAVPGDQPVGLSLPLTLTSSFELVDPMPTTPPAPVPIVSCPPDPTPRETSAAVYSHAALSVFSANGAGCPVMLLLGADAVCENAGELVAPLFQKQYCHFLGMTLGAIRTDVYPAIAAGYFDLNSAAIRAASAGSGYAETIAATAFNEKTSAQLSVLASAYAVGVPVASLVAIGEIPEHTTRGLRGAEIGAAAGAAAYVDQLVLARYWQNFTRAGGGVIICAGELSRWFSVIDRALADKPDLSITVIAFNPSAATIPPLAYPCAKVCVVSDHPTNFFSHLLFACRVAYESGGGVVVV